MSGHIPGGGAVGMPSDALPATLVLSKRGILVAANARAQELFAPLIEGAHPWPHALPARHRGGSLRLDRGVSRSCFVLELGLDPAEP